MKKFIVLVLVSFSIVPVYAQSADGKPVTAVIRELSGTVEVKVSGSSVWRPASKNMSLAQDTVISTGLKSTALISLGNSTLTVRPLTRLNLEEIFQSQSSEQIGLRLQTGRVRAEVHPPTGGKTNFAVRSPSATASVRGTVFEFDTVNLDVIEGRVRFSGSDGFAVLVGGGESSSLDWIRGQAIDPVAYTASAIVPDFPLGSGNNGKFSGASINRDIKIKMGWDTPHEPR
jgi:ferric-dicitrate binding protein FerR (iron transport regulator)